MQLSTTINEFVKILVNTPVAQLRASGLPERAMALIYSRFDFSEMTRRSWVAIGRLSTKASNGSLSRRTLSDCCALMAARYGRRAMKKFNTNVKFLTVRMRAWKPSRQQRR